VWGIVTADIDALCEATVKFVDAAADRDAKDA
jgi:hypothetical protein